MKKILLFYFGVVILVLQAACIKKEAKAQAPVDSCKSHYLADVKPFIISKCATKNCHVANFPFGNFTTYADLKAKISNGRVNTLVFDQKLMPPSSSIPLTTEELDLFK